VKYRDDNDNALGGGVHPTSAGRVGINYTVGSQPLEETVEANFGFHQEDTRETVRHSLNTRHVGAHWLRLLRHQLEDVIAECPQTGLHRSLD
jgi:hypothetical protein